MVYDPQILFNDGFYDLIDARMPDGSLLHPKFPAPLGCRTHALARLFDVMGGCLGQQSPELTTAAGYGTSPHLLYSGNDKDDNFFFIMEIGYGGIPGRPIGDGMDGHSWWPLFTNIPTEYLESYCPCAWIAIRRSSTPAEPVCIGVGTASTNGIPFSNRVRSPFMMTAG